MWLCGVWRVACVHAVIKSNGRSALTALSNTRQMQPVIKAHVKESLDVLQRRLDAKHALFCLLFLNLSRSEYSTLRNSISYQYNAEIDSYDKLIVWVNKFDDNDVLTAPAMASRVAVGARSATSSTKDATCSSLTTETLASATSSSCGRRCTLSTTERFEADFSEARAAALNIHCDATGAWRCS